MQERLWTGFRCFVPRPFPPPDFDRFHFVQRWQINLSFLYTVCGLPMTIVLLLGLHHFVLRILLQLIPNKTQDENRVGFGTRLQAVTGYDTHTHADQVIYLVVTWVAGVSCVPILTKSCSKQCMPFM